MTHLRRIEIVLPTIRQVRAAADLIRTPPVAHGPNRAPWISRPMRKHLYTLARGMCSYCDAPLDSRVPWHVDHVIPRSVSGPHRLTNLVAACAECNLSLADIIQQLREVKRATEGLRPAMAGYRMLERIVRLRIRTGQTYWERRALLQDMVRQGRDRAKRAQPDELQTWTDVKARIAHLSPRVRGRPRPSCCGTA